MTDWLRTDEQGTTRCWWPGTDELYVRYHDTEWGRPVVDDVRLFEKLVLEGFQSGLSWLTILRKRENFRAAFAGFAIEQVARFDASDIERLVTDAGIIRHRGKITSAVNNARRCCDLVDEFGSLAAYVWQFEPTDRELDGVAPDGPGIPSKTATSTRISKDLKSRGWSFVGPTTVYAFMQAMGLVNDHLDGCAQRDPCLEARRAATIPLPVVPGR